MKRRHLQAGWNGRCKYANILLQPSQALHASVVSHLARAAPEKSGGYIWKFNGKSSKFHSHNDYNKGKFVEPVNNDHLKDEKKISTETKVSHSVNY